MLAWCWWLLNPTVCIFFFLLSHTGDSVDEAEQECRYRWLRGGLEEGSEHHVSNSLIHSMEPSGGEEIFLGFTEHSLESESRSVVSDSLRSYGLYSPWNSPGKDTGVASHSLLQGIFPTQGLNSGLKPRSPALQADSLPAEPQGSLSIIFLSKLFLNTEASLSIHFQRTGLVEKDVARFLSPEIAK